MITFTKFETNLKVNEAAKYSLQAYLVKEKLARGRSDYVVRTMNIEISINK